MSDSIKTISLLGATGSIGTSTLDVIRQHPNKFKVISVAIHSNVEALLPILSEFNIQSVCIWDEKTAREFKAPSGVKVIQGMPGLLELVSDGNIEYVVNGLETPISSLFGDAIMEPGRAGKP